MKTIKEMRDEIHHYYYEHICNGYACETCPHGSTGFCFYDEYEAPDAIIIGWHRELFPEKYTNRDHTNHDPVNHPSHYTKGKIEVADFITDQKLNFDRGNAVKYVCRAGSKDPDKEIQDLEKAIWYINHEIKMLKGDAENGTKKEN